MQQSVLATTFCSMAKPLSLWNSAGLARLRSRHTGVKLAGQMALHETQPGAPW